MYYNGLYTGIKYQCVELARRYYLIYYGAIIQQVENAKDLFSVHTLRDSLTGRLFFWDGYMNISTSPRPVPGSLLIWGPCNEFPVTGHVAVVINVTRNYVYIIEQNYGQGRRRLPIRDGIVVCGKEDSKGLMGWKMPRVAF